MSVAELDREATEAGWTARRVDVGEVELHVVEAGPAEGPLLLLLHGFPEFWWSWRLQIPVLAAAGYRVAAPNLRGYAGSAAPPDVASYGMEHLVADVAGLIGALGRRRAHICGHDWGGAVAWTVAEQRPELTDRLAVVNCPHPAALLRALRRPAQLRRSSYMLAFQLPVVPEKLLLARDAALLRRLFGAMSPPDVERYVQAARRTPGFHGPIHYYRAALRDAARGSHGRPRPAIAAPTLVVWGRGDPVFEDDLAYPDPRRVPHARVELLDGAGHSPHRYAPDTVNALLVDHFAERQGQPWHSARRPSPPAANLAWRPGQVAHLEALSTPRAALVLHSHVRNQSGFRP